jgi:hypothetical protein
MKVKIFTADWVSVDNKIEKEINDFLVTLPKGAVKFVQTSLAATRTGDTDQGETEALFTIWYE